jgi:hypothetical protein
MMKLRSGRAIGAESTNDVFHLRREGIPPVDDTCHSAEQLVKPCVLVIPMVKCSLRLLDLMSILDKLPRPLLKLTSLLIGERVSYRLIAKIRDVDPAVAGRTIDNLALLRCVNQELLFATGTGHFNSRVAHRLNSPSLNLKRTSAVVIAVIQTIVTRNHGIGDGLC